MDKVPRDSFTQALKQYLLPVTALLSVLATLSRLQRYWTVLGARVVALGVCLTCLAWAIYIWQAKETTVLLPKSERPKYGNKMKLLALSSVLLSLVPVGATLYLSNDRAGMPAVLPSDIESTLKLARTGDPDAILRLAEQSEENAHYHWLMVERLVHFIREKAAWDGSDPGYVDPPAFKECSIDYALRYDPRQFNEKVMRNPLSVTTPELQTALTVLGQRKLEHELEKNIPPIRRFQIQFKNANTTRKVNEDIEKARSSLIKQLEKDWHIPRRTEALHQLIEDVPPPEVTSLPLEIHRNWIDLSYCDLPNANLAQLHLEGITMASSNLSFSNLWNTRLIKARLQGTWFLAANLWGMDVREAILTNANFAYANMGNTHLSRAWLAGANFWRANLYKSDLSGAYLIGANLKELETMMLANADGIIAYRSDFSRARVYNDDHAPYCPAKDFSDNRPSATMKNAYLKEALFINADLRNVDFSNARLDFSDLSQANLRGATLNGASLTGTVLKQTDLRGVDLSSVAPGLMPAQLSDALIDRNTVLPDYWGPSVKDRFQ